MAMHQAVCDERLEIPIMYLSLLINKHEADYELTQLQCGAIEATAQDILNAQNYVLYACFDQYQSDQ